MKSGGRKYHLLPKGIDDADQLEEIHDYGWKKYIHKSLFFCSAALLISLACNTMFLFRNAQRNSRIEELSSLMTTDYGNNMISNSVSYGNINC